MKKKFICFLFAFTVILASVSYAKNIRLDDKADLLSEKEEENVIEKLDEISDKHGIDVVVLTLESLGYEDEASFADDYYDENGFSDNGVILLYSVEENIRFVSTCGMCIDAIDDNLSDISSAINDGFENGDYEDAFLSYADTCSSLVAKYKTKQLFISIAISLVFGLIVAFVVTGSMKSQLKNVNLQPRAECYLKRDSMKVKVSRDLYLYSNVTRTPRANNNSSGTRTSSSGRTHGGGRV